MKRHQFDPWSLVGGVILTGLGLLFLVPAEPFDFNHGFRNLFGWALPVLVVLIGLALIAPALRRRQPRRTSPPPIRMDRSNSLTVISRRSSTEWRLHFVFEFENPV